MQHLKHTYDKLADSAVDILLDIARTKKDATASIDSKNTESTDGQAPIESPKDSQPRTDLFLLLQENHGSDPTLTQLWSELTTTGEGVGPWVPVTPGRPASGRR